MRTEVREAGDAVGAVGGCYRHHVIEIEVGRVCRHVVIVVANAVGTAIARSNNEENAPR